MADNERPDHQQRILDLLNRHQGPPPQQPNEAAGGGRIAPNNPIVQAEPAAVDIPDIGGNAAQRADGIALLEAQIKAVRLQVAGGNAPEGLQRVLQRAEATLARQ